jgi:DHA3 family macrolide efflux protein-like MFS transporter
MHRPSKLMNRNFLLLWQGQSVSCLGSQAFSVAMLFWTKRATGSATVMGLLQMLSSLPAVLLGPFGGTLADRYSRRRIIIFSDVLRGGAVLLLAGVMFVVPGATGSTDWATDAGLACLFVVSIFIGVVTTFFNPAISASIPELVPQERVASANSMSQLSLQLSVFIGQGLGGTLFRILGTPVLFLMNGLTYLFAAASESLVVIPQPATAVLAQDVSNWREQIHTFKKDILEGLRYVWHKRGLREIVFVSAFLNFFMVPVVILLPFFVEDVLRVTTDWYGFLLAAYGVGTLGGYLFAGGAKLTGKTRGTVMMVVIILNSLGYGALGLVRTPSAAMVLAFLGGLTTGFVTVNITTIVQITTPGEIRGRVFGLLGTISASLTPIAMGLAGVVADLVNQNIPLIYVTCGVIMGLLSILVSLDREFRGFLAYAPPPSPPQAGGTGNAVRRKTPTPTHPPASGGGQRPGRSGPGRRPYLPPASGGDRGGEGETDEPSS